MATFNSFISSIQAGGNDGKAFERFVKWFLTNDPEWATQVDQIWLWNDWPDKWGPDLGIDLVFTDKMGNTWAVQAKCYDANYYVTKKDIDSFLSESSRTIIDKRLLITSTDLIGSRAIRTCEQQEKAVTRYMLSDFENAAVEYPAHISELALAKPKDKPKPRPHQQVAIAEVVEGFQSHDRGQLIMACGTGKTFTTLWIKEQLEAEVTLVLLPSLSLLSQTLREWTAACSRSFDVLCVCSDKTVGRQSEDISVSEAPFPVTSDIHEISDFLSGGGPKVVFCTYQSSTLIAEVQNDGLIPDFNLVVADEAHRCAGKADASFSAVLDGQDIRSQKRLFTTATPRIYAASLKKKAEERGIEMYGMDDVDVFGPELHRLTFGQAIQGDLLTDYQVVIIGVDAPMVKQLIDAQEIVSIDPDTATDARSLASKVGLIKAIKDYDLKRVISFHSRVNGARDFSIELSEIVGLIAKDQRPTGSIWSDYVSGDMSAGDRATKIKKLKDLGSSDRGLLTNARCLSEGVDVPALDGVAFIDPRGSQIDIIQAVGRAIRKSEDKHKGTIVIPVFIEDGEDAEAAIEASNFKPVWDVVKALRSHDEELAEELDQYRTNMAKGVASTASGLSGKIVFDLPLTVDAEFSTALRTVLVEATTASWNFWFGLLQDFVALEGHARVLAIYKTPSGYNLGAWVNTQRTNKAKDTLTPERIAKLEALEGWVWDANAAQWDEGFGHLQDFVAREGHARMPRGYKTPSGYNLGSWAGTQRMAKAKDQLSPERIAKLEALEGWVWSLLAAQWDEGFGHLQNFVAREGHARVPKQGKTPTGYNLGDWVRFQRVNKAENKLTPERIAKLEALEGWVWDPFTTQWDEGFGLIKDFVAREGHARVPQGYKTPTGYSLGAWARKQRTNKAKDTLTPERIAKLEGLEGWVWGLLAGQWDEGFGLLQDFIAREGHAGVPAMYKTPSGYNLSVWINTQRRRRDSLSSKRKANLEALEGWAWDPLAAQWDEGFGLLQDFVAHEGHARVPTIYKTPSGYNLGVWVGGQRSRRDHLSPETIAKLEGLEGWVWDVNVARWDEGFGHLQDFAEREGQARVPDGYKTPSGYNLGNWVGSQRRAKAKDTLTPDRLAKLEGLEGWVWDVNVTRWDEGFGHLQDFAESEGHARVPFGYKTPSGYNLGNWVAAQRRNKAKDQLSPATVAKLEALEGWVWKTGA